MNRTGNHRLLIIPALMALALGAAALGTGPATARPTAAQQAVDEEDRAYSAPVNGPSSCDGGAQEAVLVDQYDGPVTTMSPNPVPVFGMQIPFSVPNGETTQMLATFDAEARLDGQANSLLDPDDYLGVQILLNGAPLPPDDDVMFTTDNGDSNATQGCRRVGAGNHLVSVVWYVVDQGAANALTGTLDDYQLTVQLSD